MSRVRAMGYHNLANIPYPLCFSIPVCVLSYNIYVHAPNL